MQKIYNMKKKNPIGNPKSYMKWNHKHKKWEQSFMKNNKWNKDEVYFNYT